MHATTVELLIGKARLEPEIAVAFAEAIDMAIANAQLVTVPILDARFAAFEAKVDARFAAFEAKVDARFAAFEAKMDTRFAAYEAKVSARFAVVEARFGELEARLEAKLDAKLEKYKAELVRWVFLVMLGNVALSAGATAILNALQHGH